MCTWEALQRRVDQFFFSKSTFKGQNPIYSKIIFSPKNAFLNKLYFPERDSYPLCSILSNPTWGFEYNISFHTAKIIFFCFHSSLKLVWYKRKCFLVNFCILDGLPNEIIKAFMREYATFFAKYSTWLSPLTSIYTVSNFWPYIADPLSIFS